MCRLLSLLCFFSMIDLLPGLPVSAAEPAVAYDISLDTGVEHDDGEWLWFHPRAAAVPGHGKDGGPAVVMTLQKHLQISDFYSGLYALYSDDMGESWTGPVEIPELAWRDGPQGTIRAVCDVTPGYHAPTGKVLALGAQLYYKADGQLVDAEERFDQTSYSVYDPNAKSWSPWEILEMPDDPKFYFSRNACAQWIVEEDGRLLVPLYFGTDGKVDYSVTVARCSFDGKTVRYISHGTEMTISGGRGLCEPSIVPFQGRYYLTLRNDARGYVTVSDDGLHYEPVQMWKFEDGEELGSYNTQQHWLAHEDGLFLVYTRRGADNDHIIRHRAPLFIAQVDPEACCVIRATERVLIPERGAAMGNFGASAMTASESWVTVGEGVWNDDMRSRGATGALFVARVHWHDTAERKQMNAAEDLATSLKAEGKKTFVTRLFGEVPLVCTSNAWYIAQSSTLPESLVVGPMLKPEKVFRLDTGAEVAYDFEEVETKGTFVTIPLNGEDCQGLEEGLCIQWPDSRWENNMKEFAEENLEIESLRSGTIITGSSTARMWNVDASFPDRLVLNRGFGGSRYSDLVRFADEVIADHKPQTVVIYDGDNDNAAGLAPAQVAVECLDSVERIRDNLHECRIIVISTQPSGSRWALHEAILESNMLCAEQLSSLENVQFLDLVDLLMTEEGQPDPECFLKDELHLSEEGYARWSAALEKHLPPDVTAQ